jgi:Ca2+-transporting ATPase
MLSAGAKLGILREELERETPRAGEWPFDPDRKRMSVARRLPAGQIRLLVKGAPDVLLERCDRVLTAKEVRSLTPEDRARISADQTRLAGRALRVLGVAWRDLALPVSPSLDAETVERELVFVGLIGMYDPPRPEAKKAVELCRSAGVRVVMITGDHPHTGLAVAREIGIATERETALGGTNLDRLSDAELAKRVPGIGVYARVTAGHKLRIVKAWKANGAVVAMTGDGVNDAPAIKGADIGIAMGLTGTEVTKEASDIVVTDDNFASIVAAVEEGRGIYDNIRKTLLYLLSGNAGELLLMTACITTGLPVPLLPIHLLWINLVTDGLPALCLATDPIDPDVMRRPPRPSTERLADRGFLTGMLLTGILTAGASLAVYLYGLRYEGPVEARTHAFATLVFAELLRSFSSRSETRPVWQVGVLSNLRLALVVLASFSLQIASHHLEPLRAVLKTAFLPWTECLALLGVALLPLAVLESLKVASRRPGAPAELAPTLNRPRGGAP